ncbi:unnamed protein product, partial [Rotaria socialis]
MYSNPPIVPPRTSFTSVPIQFTDINSATQQQQQQFHYNLLNFSASATAGLLSPTPISGSSNTINKNGLQASTQSPSQVNDFLQPQSSSKSNNTLYTTSNHPPIQQILLENLYNSVVLREKNSNQLYDTHKTRKRLSEPVFNNQQLPLQPMLSSHQQ